MTKLKTLKDLDEQWYKEYGDMLLPQKFIEGKRECEIVNDLKQEAIKWVKWFFSDENREEKIAAWIIYFFNLSEEDIL